MIQYVSFFEEIQSPAQPQKGSGKRVKSVKPEIISDWENDGGNNFAQHEPIPGNDEEVHELNPFQKAKVKYHLLKGKVLKFFS